MNRFDINKLWYRLFGVGMFATLLILFFVDKALNNYYNVNLLKTANIVLLPFAILLIILSVIFVYFNKNKLSTKKKTISDKNFYLIISVCFIGVFIMQLIIAKEIYFTPQGWDANTVLTAAEKSGFLSTRGEALNSEWYYRTFPNNVAITYLLAILLKIGRIIIPGNPYIVVLCFNVFIVCLSAYLSNACVYKITSSKSVTIITMVFSVLLICLSPWIVIAYSDTIAMPFAVFSISVYLFIKNKYIKYPLIFISCIVGYFIKPTVIIVLIALAIVDGYELIKKAVNKKLNYRRVVSLCLVITATVVCVFGAKKIAFSNHDEIFDGDEQFTLTHYLMMGLNDSVDGVYCYDDLLYSTSFENVESRSEANIAVAKQRVEEMGFVGTAKLLLKKHILNYNDGTFSWSREGDFFPQEIKNKDGFLCSLYYTEDFGGVNFNKFAIIEQTIWLTLLFGMSFCIFYKGKNRNTVALIALTLIGVTLFLMIFECRARYIYLFTPLFAIMFSVGIKSLTDLASEFIEKIKNKKELRV